MLEGIGPPVVLELSEYDCFLEDLRILGWCPKELCRRLGRGESLVYQWRRYGVPDYAKAYVNLAFEMKGS